MRTFPIPPYSHTLLSGASHNARCAEHIGIIPRAEHIGVPRAEHVGVSVTPAPSHGTPAGEVPAQGEWVPQCPRKLPNPAVLPRGPGITRRPDPDRIRGVGPTKAAPLHTKPCSVLPPTIQP